MALIDTIPAWQLLTGIAATIIGGVILGLFRRRYHQKQRARDWYGEALGMLSNLQQAGRRATAYRDGVSYAALRDYLNPLDQEMMRHANAAPERIDVSAQVELATIAAYTTGLSNLAEKSADADALDFINRVQRDAIEDFEGDYNMEDLENMFASFDFDDFAEEVDREVEVDNEKADELLSQFSEESLEAGRPTSIEEALGIPIEEVKETFENPEFLNTAVDDALEEFVELVIGLGKDTHERMEIRKERI